MVKKSVMFVAAAFALSVAVQAAAQGMVSDQRTFFTFSAPVQLPGVTLPAGKYTFRIAESQANRHIVQVFNGDGTKIVTTLFAVPAQRGTTLRDAPNNPEVQFLETPSDTPPAIDVWWYPGTNIGHEFVYPKDMSAKWAKAKSGAEKMTRGEAAPASMRFTNADAQATEPKPSEPVAEKSVPQPPAAAPAPPAPANPPVAASVRPDTTITDSSPSSSPSPNARARRDALPKTASVRPVVTAVGLALLFAGCAGAMLRRAI